MSTKLSVADTNDPIVLLRTMFSLVHNSYGLKKCLEQATVCKDAFGGYTEKILKTLLFKAGLNLNYRSRNPESKNYVHMKFRGRRVNDSSTSISYGMQQ